MIKLVAFDLDGTIGDTIPMCLKALKKAVTPYVTATGRQAAFGCNPVFPYLFFFSETSAYTGRHFYFLMSFLPVCRGLCKAWRKKIPERSEDDFLSANPAPARGRLAQSSRQTAIFTARNEKADLSFSVLKSAFRSFWNFMLFRYVSVIRGTAAMLRQTICQEFRDRADLPRYLFFRRDSVV